MLCIYPQSDMDPLHAVKWHPQQPDLVAVASETNVYLLNIADAAHVFGGEPISQSELHRVGQLFSVPSVSNLSIIEEFSSLTRVSSLSLPSTTTFPVRRLRRSQRTLP